MGDDDFDSEEWLLYADQICPAGSDNRIKVPTSFLSVGHTDELIKVFIKVLRNNNFRPPCNFSIGISSPQKALDLLRRNPKLAFINFNQAFKISLSSNGSSIEDESRFKLY